MNETGIMNERVTKERKQTNSRIQVLYSFLLYVLEMSKENVQGIEVKTFWFYHLKENNQ